MCQAVIYIPLADDTHVFMFMIPIDQFVIIVISEVMETPYSVRQAGKVAQDIIV
jgi:hypothetical protein